MTEPLKPTDDIAFRTVLGHFATGLTVVTGTLDQRAYGFTCQSFTSVSLHPPMVALFAGKDSGSWAAITESGEFCVNILSADQENLARIFALRGADKFRDVDYSLSPNGSPIICGIMGWVDCSIGSIFDAGDHYGVLGVVETLAQTSNEMPLVYFRGGYGTFRS